MNSPYDALVLVSFGGPEGPEQVIPFLENVVRGRNVPRERLLSVAHHYEIFGGVSPINEQNRLLIKALNEALLSRAIDLPVYWGNRNWHPYLSDTVKQMAADGVKKALAFVTSAYSSYSGCRMYINDIESARAAAGEVAPIIHKLPVFYNNALFVEANADHLLQTLHEIPVERREDAVIIFTAHSIPLSMADSCAYVEQLQETCRLVCQRARPGAEFKLVYQSRSGAPGQPWLEPDVCDYLREVSKVSSAKDVVIQPIGFISDHMEVMYDIEVEARGVASELGLNLYRAPTAGTHPKFVDMICDLIQDKLEKPELDSFQSCAPDCCPAGMARPVTQHVARQG